MRSMVANPHKQQIPPQRFAPVGMTNKKTAGSLHSAASRDKALTGVCQSSQGRHGCIHSGANAGGPPRCYGFQACVKANSLRSVDGVIAEERALPSAEAVERHGDGDRNVDAYHADLYAVDEVASGVAVAREDGCSVSVLVLVDHLEGSF